MAQLVAPVLQVLDQLVMHELVHSAACACHTCYSHDSRIASSLANAQPCLLVLPMCVSRHAMSLLQLVQSRSHSLSHTSGFYLDSSWRRCRRQTPCTMLLLLLLLLHLRG